MEQIKQIKRGAIMNEFTCPRRIEDGTISSVFTMGGENKDNWRDDNTCSYCGSSNPEIVMEGIETSDIEITPTDKNYKIYLHSISGKHYGMKFYFQHFSEEQKNKFIQLNNEKKLKLQEPGYFYCLPFFCKTVEKDTSTSEKKD